MLYKKVYFRLDRNGYDGRTGWKDESCDERFYGEIVSLFESDGWINISERSGSGGCPEVKKGMQELYLHPQAASGIVMAEDIPHVECLLGTACSFRHYHTDIYEDYVDMTDEEYLLCLGEQRKAITKDIQERFRTKRRDLYITGFDLLHGVNTKYRIKRAGKQKQSCDLETSFISDIFAELLSKGLIVSTKIRSRTGYRTAKPDEIQKGGK